LRLVKHGRDKEVEAFCTGLAHLAALLPVASRSVLSHWATESCSLKDLEVRRCLVLSDCLERPLEHCCILVLIVLMIAAAGALQYAQPRAVKALIAQMVQYAGKCPS
jgi:hypothetical protein